MFSAEVVFCRSFVVNFFGEFVCKFVVHLEHRSRSLSHVPAECHNEHPFFIFCRAVTCPPALIVLLRRDSACSSASDYDFVST